MKKIIDGKLYNTETAQHVASYETAGLSKNDGRYFNENLYLTSKGTFFLAGEGGGLTRWAYSNGNSSGWGNGIKVLSRETALKWCEKANIDSEIIAKFFTITEG